MQSAPLGIAASSTHSPLLGAYTHWANAEFEACIAELRRFEGELHGESAIEASVLAARAYLRLDLPDEALRKLNRLGPVVEVDARCTIAGLRGLALLCAGHHVDGMEMIHRTVTLCDWHNAGFAVRMEAIFHKAFGHWLLGEFDEAEQSAAFVATANVDILSARALALRGWIAVGKLDYQRSLALFRDAWRMSQACVGRDVALKCSLIHAVATYESLLLESGDHPNYYGRDVPAIPTALNTYKLLIGSVDSWRAVLAGDAEIALLLSAATEAADVADHWRIFGMASRAGVLQALGYAGPAKALAYAAFAGAMSLEWSGSPGESRLALLYLAERLATCDLERARRCLATFSRISGSIGPRYVRGGQPLHDAVESHARGVVAAAAGEQSAGASLDRAAQLFEGLGFRWRAADARLQLGQIAVRERGPQYSAAREFILANFSKSHLAHAVDGFVPWAITETGAQLSSGHIAIVRALCAGRTSREIANERGTSVGTVRNQLKEIYRRTGLRSIQGVIVRYGRIV